MARLRRIGYAEAHERGPLGRADRYAILEIIEDRAALRVRYEGYRQGSVVTGIPLGGPNQWEWEPGSFVTSQAGFAVVHIFGEES